MNLSIMTSMSMGKNRKIFVDTSGLLALFDRKDQYHQSAAEYYRKISTRKKVITNLIVAETYTRLRQQAGFDLAMTFLAAIDAAKNSGLLDLVYSNARIETLSRSYLDKYHDHKLSYTDAVSFAVILQPRSEIHEIFAYDRHFIMTKKLVCPGLGK
ncbi:MAG: PIN domain-containing protein [Bacillota bacterium]